MDTQVETCYACNKPKTSKEHVPPKCIFPDARYSVDNTPHRDELLTVPSCDEHNSRKSKADEYLLLVLASNAYANKHGRYLSCTKVRKAIQRHPFLKDRFQPSKEQGIPNFISIDTDNLLLNKSIIAITQALYFYEYNQKLVDTSRIDVIHEFLFFKDSKLQEKLMLIKGCILESARDIPKKGANPEIFYYQLIKSNTSSAFYLRLCFYEESFISVMYN